MKWSVGKFGRTIACAALLGLAACTNKPKTEAETSSISITGPYSVNEFSLYKYTSEYVTDYSEAVLGKEPNHIVVRPRKLTPREGIQ